MKGNGSGEPGFTTIFDTATSFIVVVDAARAVIAVAAVVAVAGVVVVAAVIAVAGAGLAGLRSPETTSAMSPSPGKR